MHPESNLKRGSYKSAKTSNKSTSTSQDNFQKKQYKKQQTPTRTAPSRNQTMNYQLDDVVVTAKRPTAQKSNAARTSNTTRRAATPTRTAPSKTTPRYTTPRNTVHPDADDTPVTMMNPNYMPATDNIQFRPTDYFGIEDPYGRSAAEAFDAEYAEKSARRQAVLDMYGIAPSGSNVSDLTSQYNYGKSVWW